MAAIGPEPKEIDYEAAFRDIESHPLFMRDLPDDPSSNKQLEALKSLIYDGEPDDIARNFKEEGNDYFKGARYREAIKFYTQGIDAKPTDKAILEALYLNRAASNLELQNYGMTLRDSAQVLTKLNPQSSKAYYRSARALLALEKYDQALDCCDRCLAFDAANHLMKNLKVTVEAKLKDQQAKLAEKERKAKEVREEAELLKMSCLARHLSFVSTSADKPGAPHFDPDEEKPYSPTTQIIFPVFFLYPQHNTSDLISHFAEHTTIGDQLAVLFPADGQPPNWDAQKREYGAKKVAVYAITRMGRLLKVGPKLTLADVFLRTGVMVPSPNESGKEVQDGLEIRDGCLSFVVVPKGDVEQAYIEDFKARKRTGKVKSKD